MKPILVFVLIVIPLHASANCVSNALNRLLGRSESGAARGPAANLTDDAQIQIWRAGSPREARLTRDAVARTLREGELTTVDRLTAGTNIPDLVRIEGTGLQGVAKSYTVGDRAVGGSEVAAYQVDEVLGLDTVPVTIDRIRGRERITVQAYVPNQGRFAGNNPVEATFVDDLLGNIDRNSGNYLRSDRRLVRIDNEMAFSESTSVTTFSRAVSETTDVAQLRRILPTRRVVESLRQTPDSAWRTRLAPYLRERQIDAFLARRREMIRIFDEVEARHGPSVYRTTNDL